MNKSQNSELRTQNSEKKQLLFFIVCILYSVFCVLNFAHAEKIYIDITSPGIKRLPIAIQNFIPEKEISDIIKDDLNFTGLFDCIEDTAQIERPEHPFNKNNWKGIGVELVVKGRVTKESSNKEERLTVQISAYDVSDGREVLKKEYSASSALLRPLSHSIANDLYKLMTGQRGIFRTKISFIGQWVKKSDEKKSELYIMDWDGHRMHGTGITGNILLTPRWSPDGTKLLYSAERNRNWDIYLLDTASMKEKNIVALKGLNISGNFFPDNREFVFSSSTNGRPDIYVGDIVNMKGRKLISSPWIDVSPSVSPDGNHILFVSNRAGSPQVYISDRDGYGIRRVTFEGSYNTTPSWSPDGSKIAYSGMVGGKNQIFVMKLDGTGLIQLTDKGNNEEPSFSPDGRYITFTSDRDGTKGIYLMRTNGEGQIRITPKGLKATSPHWSPF